MENKLNIGNLYDKNLNFIFGSGASHGYLPTLYLELGREAGQVHTVETLGKLWEGEENAELRTLLFMYYYKKCIEPAIDIDLETLNQTQSNVFQNYSRFLNTTIQTISRSPTAIRKCNLFTTNYDSCFEIAMDSLIKKFRLDFIFNDGSSGFTKKYLHAKNYNTRTYKTGVFDRHQARIPQINLVHLHGSVYWTAEDKNIVVDYHASNTNLLPNSCLADLTEFSNIITDPTASFSSLDNIVLDQALMEDFWTHYNKLPIVNPTKWKFHETVFEEHYYQMLRYMSYELETENSILVTFGFSFADEHIRHLVQRSLSNPTLQVYVCCFGEIEANNMEAMFEGYSNVSYVCLDSNLDFDAFNSEVFHLPADMKENIDDGFE